MTVKFSDYLPKLQSEQRLDVYNAVLPGFQDFMKSREYVPASQVGVEALYFDWLRTAYAYRRMLLQDLFLVAFDITEIRTCIMVRRNEVWRKGFDKWEPRFVVKCTGCGKEFQTKVDSCDECWETEVQFQGYEDELVVDDEGNKQIVKQPIYKTVYKHDEDGERISSKVVAPDLKQVEIFEKFKDNANKFGNTLEDVLRMAWEMCLIADDAFILLNCEYVFNENKLEYARPVEARALHPALVEFDLDKNGLPQQSHWFCLEHRDTIRETAGQCLECGKDTVVAQYIYNHRGKKIYLSESEIIHISLFSPGLTYGYSPILSILQKALTLSGMDKCMSSDTEVLTKDGYKLFKDVDYNTEFATLDKDGYIEYQKPTYVHSYHHKASMYALKNRQLDLLTTPHHRMLVKLGKVKHRQLIDETAYQIKEARDIFSLPVRYKKDAKWRGTEQETITISHLAADDPFAWRDGVVGGKRKKKIWSTEDIIMPMDVWLNLLGYFVTEGSTAGARVNISQYFPNKREIMYANLSKTPFKWHKCNGYFACYDARLAKYLNENVKRGAKNKQLPAEILNLSSRQLKILYYAMLLGDGSVAKNGAEKYITSSEKLRDQVMEMALKMGWAASYDKATTAKNPCYNVYIAKALRYIRPVVNIQKQDDAWVDYDDKVYCVEVPNQTLYVRRNGKTCWTLNTLYRYFFERKTPSGIIITYTDDPQSLEVSKSRVEAKIAEDPTYIPWIAASQRTGRGRCVTKDSLMWTSEGLLTMEELYAGEHTSVETKVGMQKIIDKIKFENKPIVEVTLGQNIALKCTPNHPLWTKRGWVEASKLTSDDYVLSANGRNSFPNYNKPLPLLPRKTHGSQKRFTRPRRLTTYLARLIGYYVAEGWMSTDGYTVSIACKKQGVIDDLTAICTKLNLECRHYTDRNEFTICNSLFVQWFKILVDWQANGAHLKKVPYVIRTASRCCVLSFLAGYFADGTFSHKLRQKGGTRTCAIVEWRSASKDLLAVVQQFVINLGIRTTLTYGKGKRRAHHTGEVYDGSMWKLGMQGNQAVKFGKILLPHMRFDQQRFVVGNKYRGQKEVNHLHSFLKDDFGTWVRVYSVKDAGIEDVYDLTVENTHSYVANGLVVHNTDFIRLFHTLQEMNYLPVRDEIRERIAMVFGVPPLWQSDTAGMGGVGATSRQLEMFSRVVESDQRLVNEKLIPKILHAFGITDWKLRVRTPEEKTEEARLSFATQKVQTANVLFQMGFDIELAAGKGNSLEDVDFVVSGKARKPEMPMQQLGPGGGMQGMAGEVVPPGQEDAAAGETIHDAGEDVSQEIENDVKKESEKNLPFGTRFSKERGIHSADLNKNNMREDRDDERWRKLRKEWDKYANEFNPDKK